MAKKSGQMASFKNKSGHEKTQCLCGFAGFVAKNPLLFVIIREKKILILYKYKNKSGQLTTSLFLKHANETSTIFVSRREYMPYYEEEE